MGTIYLVSRGSYSDYSVCGAFSTRERAQAYMNLCPRPEYDGWNDIEEMEIDRGISEVESGLSIYQIRITKSGDVRSIEKSGLPENVGPIRYWSAYEIRWERNAPGEKYRHEMIRTDFDTPQHFTTVFVWARDEAHAIKLANERRIAALADPTVKTSR